MALATFVLPVAVADAESMEAAVRQIEADLDMPLLLRAVRSQSVPLVCPSSPHARMPESSPSLGLKSGQSGSLNPSAWCSGRCSNQVIRKFAPDVVTEA